MHHLEGQLVKIANEVMVKDEELGNRLLTLASISHEYYLTDSEMSEQQIFESHGIKLRK